MSITLNDNESSFSSKDLTSSVQLISFVADREYVLSARADIGNTTGPLNTDSGDTTYTIKAKVTHTDSTVSEAYIKTITKRKIT